MVLAADERHLPADRQAGPVSRVAGTVFGTWSVEVHASPEAVRADWLALEQDAALPFSSYAWAEAWFSTVASERGERPFVVLGRDAQGGTGFLLPFVMERRGPLRVLSWPGATHCAYHAGLFSPLCRRQVAERGGKAFWTGVLAALSEADALLGYGLPVLAHEQDNPLSMLPSIETGCNAYRLELQGGWEHVYARRCGARLQHDNRRCERRLAELGDVRFRIAETPHDRLQLVETLLDHKSSQLCEAGAPDFTAQPGVRAFYRKLVNSPQWRLDARVMITALEIDGRPVAINLGLVKDATYHGLIQAMPDGKAARFAPGRQLLKRCIEHACNEGLATFDLGAGDNRGKHRWSETAVQRHDILVGITLRGKVFILAMKAILRAKCHVKNSPALWRAALGCRRGLIAWRRRFPKS